MIGLKLYKKTKTKMISITKMKSDSASTVSGVGTCSDKINLQLHKCIVDLRDVLVCLRELYMTTH